MTSDVEARKKGRPFARSAAKLLLFVPSAFTLFSRSGWAWWEVYRAGGRGEMRRNPPGHPGTYSRDIVMNETKTRVVNEVLDVVVLP